MCINYSIPQESSQKTSSMDGLTKLHQSQSKAYEEAAKINFKSYVQQYKPPPIPSNNLQPNDYIRKCVESSIDDCGGWRVDELTIDKFVVVEVTIKARHYFLEQKKLLNIETNSNSTTSKRENTEMKKLPSIEEGEQEEGEDAEQSNAETVSDDAHDEEITSEEDGEEEEEIGDDGETLSNTTEKVKAPHGETSKDAHNAQTPTKKNTNLSSSQPKTKISLLKVTRGKRPATSTGGQAKNAKARKINLSSGNTAQGKKSRSGRGRGRGRRRGGKN